MKSAVILALIAPLVAGHGAIIKATAPGGGTGMALGINSATPRDDTRRGSGQQDSTRFKGDAADTVGETLGGGTNSLEAGTQAIMAETGDMLPQIAPGGSVTMTVHQVNGDGAGPYGCAMNADGTAQTWTDITVTKNVPGEAGRNRDGATTDFPLEVEVPANMACTGNVAGQENVCLVRCMNPANAGPFGGVVPVQMAGAGNQTAATARRALAEVVRRNTLTLEKRQVNAPLSPEEIAEEEDDEEDN